MTNIYYKKYFSKLIGIGLNDPINKNTVGTKVFSKTI